ncbi:MAG: glucose-6-phosphate dehydrogenase, partial [Candidatus Saccharimonas sp.]
MTEQQTIQPTILIIIGVTGDLSRRKLLPALEKIGASSIAPEKLRIVGITRQQQTVDDVLARVSSHVDYVRGNLEVYSMSLVDQAEYIELKAHLDSIEQEMGGSAQRLIYLSVPPQISQPIVELLGESGIAQIPHTKLLLEKPFGVDLSSAKELIEQAKRYFDEDQLYRIDHYLAKEMTQNLVVFRQQNSLFKRTWNRDFIDSIEIVASETIGIEGRAEFYEQTGALRDLIQSHLLQLAALTLADLPTSVQDGDWKCVPTARLHALQHII